MHAWLVVGGDGEARKEGVGGIVKKLGAVRLEFPVKKIAEVKDLNRFTNLGVPEKTAIFLPDFDEATEEAQNAFLKNLEEPQEKLFFILTAESTEGVLETIASRCEIVEVTGERSQVTDEARERVKKFIRLTPGEKLQTTAKIKDRGEAVEFMEEKIRAGHSLLTKDPSYAKFVEAAAQTLKALEANGNVQLQLTNFVVNVS